LSYCRAALLAGGTAWSEAAVVLDDRADDRRRD